MADQEKPVVVPKVKLFDKNGKEYMFEPVDAKEILAMPDCLYSKEKPEPVFVAPAEQAIIAEPVVEPVVEEMTLELRKKKKDE